LWRKAWAMLLLPAWRRTPMARLRRLAMAAARCRYGPRGVREVQAVGGEDLQAADFVPVVGFVL
jgi:hypothetical protein